MRNSSTEVSAADGDAPPLNCSSLYSEGEKVLSYHNKRIYEAKVLNVELQDDEWRYFVHYLGWNKVWDEWVGVDRLLKHNEENIVKQKTLDKEKSTDNNTNSVQLTQMNPESSAVEKGKRRKNDSGTEETVSLEKLVKSQIPLPLRKQVVDVPEFVSQLDKGFLGMDTGSSRQIGEINKKGTRRVWTKQEEGALLDILVDLVAKGHHANHAFTSGTLTIIENALRNMCPGSGLKASPHIESKIKKLKKQFRIVYDMVNNTGFRWNDVKKCVNVESEKTWKAYLQHHKEACGWRDKYFPLYDRLVKIFKVDNANVKTSQTPAEIIEEMNCDEVNATEFRMEEDTCPRSADQNSMVKQTDQSHSSQGKKIRRDSGGSNQINETTKKGTRRKWTNAEEGALLGILEDLVAKGYLANGTFKSGTLTLIENALCNLCPGSGLKASPHVESKLKKLKKECRIIYDMLSRSGFGWSELKKCVEVESEETWKTYVQHHKEADGWRDKYFPLYERLINIFGVGHATAKPSQTPVERLELNCVEEINCDEDGNSDEDVNSDEESADFGTEEQACSKSVDQISTNKQTDQSHSSPQRNRRRDDGLGIALDKVSASLVEMVNTSNEKMRGVLESLQYKGNKTEELRRELKNMGLSITGRVKALRLFMANPLDAELFLSLDNEEKLEFVVQLIDESSKK